MVEENCSNGKRGNVSFHNICFALFCVPLVGTTFLFAFVHCAEGSEDPSHFDLFRTCVSRCLVCLLTVWHSERSR